MTSFRSSNMNLNSNNTDYSVPESPSDSIQSLSWSPNANVLVSGSWDNQVSCWEVHHQGNQLKATPKARISHDGPVLCTAISGDGATVFSGSCDKTAKMWQLNGPAQGQQIAAHEAPISGIAPIQEANCVVTGSWDKTLKYWDTRSPNPQAVVQLPERCYAMDVRYPLMVVATAERKIVLFDLQKPTVIYRTVDSPLKYQTRCVSCFPDKTGYAIGSVEGRVAINYVEPKDASKHFAFKCHRDTNIIYPVNSINFHQFGTFSTAGSDGTYNFWDKDSRQRLKSFPKRPLPITASGFNFRGDLFAYATSYDWSRGIEHFNAATMKNNIWISQVQESSIQPRKK